MTLGNDNGTDGQTDRVRRIMRPPPREEGRIITHYIEMENYIQAVRSNVCVYERTVSVLFCAFTGDANFGVYLLLHVHNEPCVQFQYGSNVRRRMQNSTHKTRQSHGT